VIVSFGISATSLSDLMLLLATVGCSKDLNIGSDPSLILRWQRCARGHFPNGRWVIGAKTLWILNDFCRNATRVVFRLHTEREWTRKRSKFRGPLRKVYSFLGLTGVGLKNWFSRISHFTFKVFVFMSDAHTPIQCTKRRSSLSNAPANQWLICDWPNKCSYFR
jgi:hypothetical protein